MKKIPALLLALSLVANIVLAAFLHRATTAAAPAGTAAAGAVARIAADASILASVQTGDIDTLLARLKAAGIPEKTARYVAAALEFQKFADQMAELSPPQPYWRIRQRQTPAERVKMQQLMHNLQNTVTDLLGDSLPQMRDTRYSYLTPERRAELRRLEKDYDDLNAEMIATAGNFRLQSDTDNLKALADERKREIEQFLTPEEIAARDMRQSDTARRILSDYGNIMETEAEYQSVYEIMQAAGTDPDAQAAARARIEASLGPDRMAKLARLNDPDHELNQAAAARLSLPPAETAASLTAIRAEAQQASAAIAADKSLSTAQRKAALQAIADKSRSQMDTILGAEGADTYAQRAQWMHALKNGAAFTIDERGKFRRER